MSSVSGTSGTIGSPLPKWQLALAVGAPVAALGLGYMYYRNTSSKASQKSPKQKEANVNGTDKQISIDGDIPATVLTTTEILLKEAQQYKEEGNKLFRDGKYDAAIAQYNEAISKCPKDDVDTLAILYQNRAAAYEHLNMYSAVKNDCTMALQLKPHYIKALIRRALALEHCKEYEQSFEDLTTACMLERFTNQRTITTADNILKKLGKKHADEYMVNKKPVMPSEHFIKSYFMPFSSDPIYSNLNQLTTENDSAFAKAVKAFKDHDYENIIQLCTEEINSSNDQISAHLIEAHLLRGTFYLLLGLHENAMEDLDFVINNSDSTVDCKVNALIKRASVNSQLGHTEQTFKDYSEAEELNPNCSDIYHSRGQIYLIMENIDAAKTDFSKALMLNPNNSLAYVQKCFTNFRYGITKKDTGIMECALKEFENALKKFPNCVDCYILYAETLSDMQEFSKADDYYAQAMEIDPKNALVYVQRGVSQMRWSGNVDKAVEYIKKALELDEKCAFGYETLGSLEFQRGNLKEAIELFDKALSLCRSSIEIAHIFGFKSIAKTQLIVKDRLGEDVIQNMMSMP